MEDIILASRNNVKARKYVRFANGCMRTFMLSLLLGLIAGLDFVLFIRSGTVLTADSGVVIAVMISLLYICGAAFVLMLLTCFFRELQYFVFAVCCAVLAWGFMYQFLQVEPANYLADVLQPITGSAISSSLIGYSHWIIAGIVFLGSYWLAAALVKYKQYHWVGILLFVVYALLGLDILSVKQKPYQQEVFTSLDSEFAANDRKVIFLFLPQAVSPAVDTAQTDKGSLLKDVTLGFLAENGFKLYPNAYLTNDRPNDNLAELLNQLDDKPVREYMNSKGSVENMWQFNSPQRGALSLKNNQLRDVFKKAKYKISAYQNMQTTICRKNGKYAVDRCVSRTGLPFGLNELKLSDAERVSLLLLQWANSMGFLDNHPVETALRYVTDRNSAELISRAYNKMYVIGSFDILQTVLNDVANDKSAGVYFVVLDFPNNLAVYDERCNLKRPSFWKIADSSTVEYSEQMLCFWGQMGEFMQQLADAGQGDKLTFVIQGLGSYTDTDTDIVHKFQHQNTVLTAVRDVHGKFGIYPQICRSKDILRHNLFNAPQCEEFKGTAFAEKTKENIRKQAGESQLKGRQVPEARKTYQLWREEWQKNGKLFIHAPVKSVRNNNESEDQQILTTQAAKALTDVLDTEVEQKNYELPVLDEVPAEEKTETVQEAEQKQPSEPVVEPSTDVAAPQKAEDVKLEDVPLEHSSAEEKSQDTEPKKAAPAAQPTVEIKDEIPLEATTSAPEVTEELPASAPATQEVVIELPEVQDNTSAAVAEEHAAIIQQQPEEVTQIVIQDAQTQETVHTIVMPANHDVPNVNADFLLQDVPEEWELDPAKALGVSGDGPVVEKIIVNVK